MTDPQAAIAEPVAAPAGTCDVLVQLAGCRTAEEIRSGAHAVSEAVASLDDNLSVAIACSSSAGALAAGQIEEGLLSLDFHPPDRFPVITQAATGAYRVLFNAGRRTNARAMVMIGSDADRISTDLVQALVRPIVVDGFDVVAPLYVRQVFDRLLNAGVVAPMMRALYGKRLVGQLGSDYGFSAQVASRWGQGEQDTTVTRPTWILPQAIADGMRICQAYLPISGPRMQEPVDLATALNRVLGPLFLDLEQRAPFWQRVQRSQSVPAFGSLTPNPVTSEPVDVRPMIESFINAYRNLQSVWTLILPPATLVALKSLTLKDRDKFRMPDDLWARIVYDFALAYRLRTINRDHLLGALVPLYLAWVASYAIEVQGATRALADVRLEHLGVAFEAEKPYLVRRWRWPDRFNP
jgi:hypothetical protein